MGVSGQLQPPAVFYLAPFEQASGWVSELDWTLQKRENYLSLHGIELRLLGIPTRSHYNTNDHLLQKCYLSCWCYAAGLGREGTRREHETEFSLCYINYCVIHHSMRFNTSEKAANSEVFESNCFRCFDIFVCQSPWKQLILIVHNCEYTLILY
jgi:hypothetical protein